MEKSRDHQIEGSLSNRISCDVKIHTLKIGTLAFVRVITAVPATYSRKPTVFFFFDLIRLRYQVIKCVDDSIVKYLSIDVQFLNVTSD